MIPDSQDEDYLRALTVLYVEDDPQSLEAVGIFLGRRVGRLLSASKGADGLLAYQAQRPHIVITDIQMPGMDGLTMAQEIRKADATVPIIVTTAFEQTGYLMRSIELNIDRYVLKPVQPDLLEAALLHCSHQLRAEAELHQRRLVERELLMARQQEAISFLAQGIAHDYNNLLQAILASVDTAANYSAAGSPAHQVLSLAKRYAGVAQQLGKQLVALGDANVPLDQEGSLEPLVSEAISGFTGGPAIHCTLQVPPGLPSVRYNRPRLDQAWAILLENARDAMPQGGTLDISATAEVVATEASHPNPLLRPGAYVRIDFKDSGAGIPAEQLTRIFDPYYSSKSWGAKKGQGMGLAICRSTLLAHGGQITAESEVGRGSTFHVYLPASDQASGA